MKKVLRTLFPKWNNVDIIIKNKNNLYTLGYNQLIGFLMSHEERLKDTTPSIGFVGEEEEEVKVEVEIKKINNFTIVTN